MEGHRLLSEATAWQAVVSSLQNCLAIRRLQAAASALIKINRTGSASAIAQEGCCRSDIAAIIAGYAHPSHIVILEAPRPGVVPADAGCCGRFALREPQDHGAHLLQRRSHHHGGS